jgi:hypothetical protein
MAREGEERKGRAWRAYGMWSPSYAGWPEVDGFPSDVSGWSRCGEDSPARLAQSVGNGIGDPDVEHSRFFKSIDPRNSVLQAIECFQIIDGGTVVRTKTRFV